MENRGRRAPRRRHQVQPATARFGNEELESWLLRLLSPKIDFRFFAVDLDGQPVVVLEVDRASRHPVQLQGQEFIRVGSYKKKLKEFPEKERALWRTFDRTPFEDGVAEERVPSEEVLKRLDYPAYFDLLDLPLPEGRGGILQALVADELIRAETAGGWSITNLGAILFARRLDDFRSLRRKAVRVIQCRGDSRVETLKERLGTRGYASGFEGMIGYVNGLLPANEVIGQSLRKTAPMVPELAIRELVANALIHQDFFVTGAGPMVEIFDDRMEVSNPGTPLISTERFLDNPPRSRNEALASLMRRFGVCEERGSGVDKVVSQTELYQLPAPLFEVAGESTRAVLFSHRPLNRMDASDRIRACHLHACLKYASRDSLTNRSLRELRPRAAEQRRRVTADRGGRERRRHRPPGRDGCAQADEVRPVVGRSVVGSLMRVQRPAQGANRAQIRQSIPPTYPLRGYLTGT